MIDLDHASVWKRRLIYQNQDPPLDDPSIDLEQSSIRNMGFVWIMVHIEGVLSG